ncbi:MAG: hypothetical protein JWL80_348 [Parcubacteria group bacterium]|nr:hypothetical protein [Parcubacteria group bacterium]
MVKDGIFFYIQSEVPMRRSILFLFILIQGCSPEGIATPEVPSLLSAKSGAMRPKLPRPVPISLRDSFALPPVISYPELLAKATLSYPRLTKMPLDPFGNDDYVHPDVLLGGTEGCVTKKQIATPYKGSNANFENPTYFCLNSSRWISPSFMNNPLVPHPGPNRYNSDPDMFYDPALKETVITWREVDATYNSIKALTTKDEVNIFQKGELFQERNHNAVSQTSVLEPDRSRWNMWYVQSGGGGCTAPSTQVMLREAIPIPGKSVTAVPLKVVGPVNIAQPGYVIWHIDVIRAEGIGYIMLAAAYPKGTDCGHCDLFLYVSQNRTDWENFAIPFLWRSMPGFNVKTLYRGSLLYDVSTGNLSTTLSSLSVFGHWDIWEDGVYKLSMLLYALRSAKAGDMPVISASKIGIDIPHALEKIPFNAP